VTTSKQAPAKTATRTKRAPSKAAATAKKAKTTADDGGRWLSDLERSLLRYHQAAGQRRALFRGAHRMPFVQCRQCDELRQAAIESKRQQLESGSPAS
jgi:hypothetical protein